MAQAIVTIGLRQNQAKIDSLQGCPSSGEFTWEFSAPVLFYHTPGTTFKHGFLNFAWNYYFNLSKGWDNSVTGECRTQSGSFFIQQKVVVNTLIPKRHIVSYKYDSVTEILTLSRDHTTLGEVSIPKESARTASSQITYGCNATASAYDGQAISEFGDFTWKINDVVVTKSNFELSQTMADGNVYGSDGTVIGSFLNTTDAPTFAFYDDNEINATDWQRKVPITQSTLIAPLNEPFATLITEANLPNEIFDIAEPSGTYLEFDGVDDVITTGAMVGGSFDDRVNTSADWTLDIDWLLDDSGLHRFLDRSEGSDAALIRSSDGLVRFNLRVGLVEWNLGADVIPVGVRFTLRLQKVAGGLIYRLYIDTGSGFFQVGGDDTSSAVTQFNWDVFGKDGGTGDRFRGKLYQIKYTANAFAGDSLHLINSANLTTTTMADISGNNNNATLTGFSATPWKATNGGGDIRLGFSDNGTNIQPLDVVEFDTFNRTAVLWTRIPEVGVGQQLWIYYGKLNEVQPLADGILGSKAVWNDYTFASHDGGATDSAGNIEMTAVGNLTPNDSVGKIGRATSFDNASYFEAQSRMQSMRSTDFHMSAWAYPVFDGGDQVLFGMGDSDAPIRIRSSRFQYAPFGAGGGSAEYISPSGGIPDNQWYHVVITRKFGVSAELIINGVSIGTSAGSNASTKNSNDQIGAFLGANYFGGLIDEVTVYKGQPNNPLLLAQTEYENQNSPATFWTVGTPENTVGGGPTPINADINFDGLLPSFDIQANTDAPVIYNSDIAFNLVQPSFSVNANTDAPITSADIEINVLQPSFSIAAEIDVPVFTSDVNITGLLPSFSVTANALVPSTGATININGIQPSFSIIGNTTAPITSAITAFNGIQPSFSIQADVLVPVTPADIEITLLRPSFSINAAAILPGNGASVFFQALQPSFTVDASTTIPVFNAGVAIDGPQPSFTVDASTTAPVTLATVSVTALQPSFSASAIAVPPGNGATVLFSLPQPVFSVSAEVTAPIFNADITFEVLKPSFTMTALSLSPPVEALISYAGTQPTFNVRALSFTGEAPNVNIPVIEFDGEIKPIRTDGLIATIRIDGMIQ